MQNFKVYQDGAEIKPAAQERVAQAIQDVLERAGAYLLLQAKMAAYDAIHRTHYRRTRNKLIRQERNKRFMDSIGLVPVTR